MSDMVSQIFFTSWYVVLASGVVFVFLYASTVAYLKNKDYDKWMERRSTYGMGFALVASVVRGAEDDDENDGGEGGVDHVLLGKRVLMKRSLLVFTIAFTVFVICFPFIFLENLIVGR